MKETSNMSSLWKKSVQWEKMTLKQKVITVWFGLSFGVLAISGESLLLTVLAAVNFGLSALSVVKNVPTEED